MKSPLDRIGVCIVEDNHFFRNTLEHIIRQSASCELKGVYASGEDAIKDICKQQPNVVLMDLDLGEVSGISALKKLKQNCPQIQFMICSAHEEEDRIFEALSAGANGYVLKDTKPEELIEAIKELVDGGAPMSSKIARRVVNSFQQKDTGKKENLLECLSSREFELLELLVKGMLYKEIAAHLNIAQETVRKHVYNIYKKLHVNNRVEAYHKYYGS